MATIAAIHSNQLIPHRLEGNVVVENGMVTVTYREKGFVKPVTKTFPADDVTYLKGEAGYVIAFTNDAVTKVVGELATSKDGRKYIKTEAGNVVLAATFPHGYVSYSEVDDDSREARAAERGSKVKARVSSATKPERASSSKTEKRSREDRKAARTTSTKTKKR